jgi:hypothetical protein
MRKHVRKLRLARETLHRLETIELGKALGQQLPSQGMNNCTETSCGYNKCAPSNPYPCDGTAPLAGALA